MNKDMKNLDLVTDFLSSLKTDINVMDYVNVEDITEELTFDKITDIIAEGNGFNVEIIYYVMAIEFLKNNDPSLTDSLSLASKMGFAVESLSSGILASLLASDMLRSDWFELENTISDFLNSLSWD